MKTKEDMIKDIYEYTQKKYQVNSAGELFITAKDLDKVLKQYLED